MQLKTLEKMRNIVRDATRIRDLKEWFDKKKAEPSCDKLDAGFCIDNRFALFDLGSISFDCYVGYFGNSSCSRPFTAEDPDAVRKAFKLAVNTHKWLLLKTMSDYLMAQAEAYRDQAEKEIAEAQALLIAVKKEAENPCITE